RHVVLGDALVEGLAHRLDIVLGVGLAVAGFLRGGDRHDSPPFGPESGCVPPYIENSGPAGNTPVPACGAGPPCVQVLVAPPSTAIVCPLMKSESVEARKTSVPTRSSGPSSRLMARRWIAGSRADCRWPGLWSITLSLIVKPGARVLTQILCAPSSRD